MLDLDQLVQDVRDARSRYISLVGAMSPEQAHFKPAPDVWSATENTEHIVRAEHGGLNGMFRAIEGEETGQPAWEGETPHQGKTIEEIVAETWKEKEEVPQGAGPSWGGSLRYWIAAFEADDHVLAEVARALRGHDLDSIHYPHPISGPLNMRQRLEFLRYHTDRHRAQVERLTRHPDFPTG